MDADISFERDGEYNVIKVNEEKVDSNVAPALKREIVLFFGTGKDKELGGEKNCMDLSRARYMDNSGLSVLDALDNLNGKMGYGKAYLRSVNDAVERLVVINRYDTHFEFI